MSRAGMFKIINIFSFKNFRRDHEEFLAALEEHIKNPDKPLSDQLQTAINFQYRIQVRSATDPYKKAVRNLFYFD